MPAFSPSASALHESLARDTAQRITMPNGLTVLHRPDFCAELVSVQLWVKTGSIHEGAWLGAGLSHFLEHMLFKGTPTRGPLDISRQVQAIGGYINAYTSYDRTVYYIDAPSESAETAFDLLSDMAFQAALPEAAIMTERDVILREIAMGEDDPDRRLFHQFTATRYRQHPYRHPVIGWKPLFEKVSPDDLRAYYHARYVPNNCVLVVVGALGEAALQSLVERHFGKVPRGFLAPVTIPEEPPQLAARKDLLRGEVQIERGLLGFSIPGLGHADLPALEVLALELGHGQSSRLWQELREKRQLVHHIDAACWTPGREGMLWMSYVCDPGKREAVEEAISEVVASCQAQSIAAEAVQKAIHQTLASEVNARKTMSGQAARLGVAETVLGDLGYHERHIGLLAAVSPAALQEVAQRHLREDALSSVALVPEATAGTAQDKPQVSAQVLQFSEHTLPNGARLLLQPCDRLPKIHLRFACLGGPVLEAPDKRGVTGLLASMLVRDTQQRSAEAVARAVEAVGGSFSEFIGNNTFGFSLEVLPDDLPLALDLLNQALNHLQLEARTFEVERAGQMAAIREEEDEILELGQRKLRARFFGEHPLAIDYLGRLEDLEAMTLEDIQQARRQQLVGPACVLAVSGDFEHPALAAPLEGILARLSSEAILRPHLPFEPPAQGDFRETVPRQQAVVLRAYPDVGARSETFILSEVLDELFSGMSSELFNRVREEKGLAYYVGSSRMPGLDHGMFSFYAGTEPGREAELRGEIDAEIARIKRGAFKPGELESCKRRLAVKKRQGQQAPGARAMQAALNALYGLPVNAHLDYETRLRAISPEQLAAHATQLLDQTHAVDLILGPDPG